MNWLSLNRTAGILALNAVFLCVLVFYRTSAAAPGATNQQFANAISQRMEIVDQLKELNRQLKQQNLLLQSGQLKVVVVESKHQGGLSK